jgi:hypothetical protein
MRHGTAGPPGRENHDAMPEDTKLPLASPDPAADLLARLREAAPHEFGEGGLDSEKCRR